MLFDEAKLYSTVPGGMSVLVNNNLIARSELCDMLIILQNWSDLPDSIINNTGQFFIGNMKSKDEIQRILCHFDLDGNSTLSAILQDRTKEEGVDQAKQHNFLYCDYNNRKMCIRDRKYSDKEIKKSGYYIDKGKLNTKKAGTYEVIVKAFDVNGNKTEKKFKVIVKEKEKAKATTEGQKSEAAQNNNNAGQRSETSSPSTGNQNAGTSGGQGSSTANTGSSSGSNGAQNSTPSQAKPSTPAPAPSEPYIVDDGRKNPEALPISMQSPIFDTLSEAEALSLIHI